MRSAKATSSKAGRFVFTAFAAIALASAPSFVFAQHGGGHGGGGGGGAHAGGGGRSSGGFSGSSGRSSGGGSPARSSAGSYRPRLPRPAIRAPALPIRAPAEMPIARQRHTTREETLIEPHPEIAGPMPKEAMPEGARGANASRVAPSDSQWHSFRPSTSARPPIQLVRPMPEPPDHLSVKATTSTRRALGPAELPPPRALQQWAAPAGQLQAM